MNQKVLCFLPVLLLIVLLLLPAAAYAAGVGTAAAEYVYKQVQEPICDTVGGEWALIGLSRGGYAVSDSYYQGYYNRLLAEVKAKNGVLHTRKYTEYSRVILALTAVCKNPADVGGYNLFKPLEDYEATLAQGLNGAIWALIALDSGDYPSELRQEYLKEIIGRQNPDGGFSLAKGGASTADITAMALQALAPYRQQKEAADAVNKAVSCLAALQNSDGGFNDNGITACESTAQVIIALCALGIDIEDTRFVKDGKSAYDNLQAYALADGGYKHTQDSKIANQMATEQALLALVALDRAADGQSFIYDMTKQQQQNADGKLFWQNYFWRLWQVFVKAAA